MPEETANPNPTQAAPAEPAKPELAPEVIELARKLAEDGMTQDAYQGLIQGRDALNTMGYLLKENPKEFFSVIERQDPETAKKALEEFSQIYLDRNLTKDDQAKLEAGQPLGEADPMKKQLEDLQTEIKSIRDNEQRREQSAAMASIQKRYEARMDDLFGQLPDNMPKHHKTALRALLDRSLGGDEQAASRIRQGNFVDVPKHFKNVLDGWAAETKAANDAEIQKREDIRKRAQIAFTPGAEAVGGPPPESLAEKNWDDFGDELGRILGQAVGAGR